MKSFDSISLKRKRELLTFSPSKTLIEALSIDLGELFVKIFPSDKKPALFSTGISFVKKMNEIGEWIFHRKGLVVLDYLQKHPSDTVRGWGCSLIGKSMLSFEEALERMIVFADDPHFGVREWAQMALREKLLLEPKKISALTKLKNGSENLRRFSVEITRPRGVWTKHFQELKKAPQKGLFIIEPFLDDPALYVQKAVGNWLNDSAKNNLDWTVTVCRKWLNQSRSKQTCYIVKRALRSKEAKTRYYQLLQDVL